MLQTSSKKPICKTQKKMDLELPQTYVEGFHNERTVQQMKYSKIGNCDLELSKLGIGGAAFGNYYGHIEEEAGISLVREGLKQGINFIDTAPFYGHTSSETLIGKALAEVPRSAFHLSTKVGRYGTSWADFFDHSAERILKEFEESLTRLGLDYVDILLVHDIEFSPMQQILTQALPAIQSLKEKKKVRYIGVSGYPLSVLSEAVKNSSVKIDVVLSYARSCIFDNTIKSYASFFQEHNVGLINASLIGMGMLTNAGPPAWHPGPAHLRQTCRGAANYCKEQGVELGRLAIYHAMQHPWFSSHLVSMKSLDELKSNVEIATSGITHTEEKVLEEVKKKFFNSGENVNWEGVELAEYHEFCRNNKANKGDV